ncbi:hypothetical protein M885DRAFT_542899 [Pelagophyceae sp. CCMP2097]|nr:hypothetical protein M885DRAFT_542899 [Pelagophyceae sp. CCMP2097]
MLSPSALALRAALVIASSASVWISDGYHNPDFRKEAVTPTNETRWLRRDYVGISAILTTNLWLWASNLAQATSWSPQLRGLATASAACTALVALTANTIVPRRKGHLLVKLTLAVQFVGLLGALVLAALRMPLWSGVSVYLCYTPGFILYATKWPKNPKFGYHEYFHSSTLLGHVVSMALDLRHIICPL